MVEAWTRHRDAFDGRVVGFRLASVGGLWTAALIPGAFFFPAYSGESSGSSGGRPLGKAAAGFLAAAGLTPAGQARSITSEV